MMRVLTFLSVLLSLFSCCYLVSVTSLRVCPLLSQRIQYARQALTTTQRKPRLFFADTEGVNYEMYKVGRNNNNNTPTTLTQLTQTNENRGKT
jgi:hypothetical protein